MWWSKYKKWRCPGRPVQVDARARLATSHQMNRPLPMNNLCMMTLAKRKREDVYVEGQQKHRRRSPRVSEAMWIFRKYLARRGTLQECTCELFYNEGEASLQLEAWYSILCMTRSTEFWGMTLDKAKTWPREHNLSNWDLQYPICQRSHVIPRCK